MKTPGQILAEAADLVEFSGRWGQGGGLRLCPHLAVCELVPSASWASERHPLLVATEQAILREVGESGGWPGVWHWNDTPGRTKEEVAAALRNAKRHLAPEDV